MVDADAEPRAEDSITFDDACLRECERSYLSRTRVVLHPYRWPSLHAAWRIISRLRHLASNVRLDRESTESLGAIVSTFRLLMRTPLSLAQVPEWPQAQERFFRAWSRRMSGDTASCEHAFDELERSGSPIGECLEGIVSLDEGAPDGRPDIHILLQRQDDVRLTAGWLQSEELSAECRDDNARTRRNAPWTTRGVLIGLPESYAYRGQGSDVAVSAQEKSWMVLAPHCEELHIIHDAQGRPFRIEDYQPFGGFVMPSVEVDDSQLAPHASVGDSGASDGAPDNSDAETDADDSLGNPISDDHDSLDDLIGVGDVSIDTGIPLSTYGFRSAGQDREGDEQYGLRLPTDPRDCLVCNLGEGFIVVYALDEGPRPWIAVEGDFRHVPREQMDVPKGQKESLAVGNVLVVRGSASDSRLDEICSAFLSAETVSRTRRCLDVWRERMNGLRVHSGVQLMRNRRISESRARDILNGYASGRYICPNDFNEFRVLAELVGESEHAQELFGAFTRYRNARKQAGKKIMREHLKRLRCLGRDPEDCDERPIDITVPEIGEAWLGRVHEVRERTVTIAEGDLGRLLRFTGGGFEKVKGRTDDES